MSGWLFACLSLCADFVLLLDIIYYDTCTGIDVVLQEFDSVLNEICSASDVTLIDPTGLSKVGAL